MPHGTWVDAEGVRTALLEYELMDHWRLVGVPYTRYTQDHVLNTVRAFLTGIARQGGHMRPAKTASGARVDVSVDALVQHLIAARATQPRELTPEQVLTHTRGDVDVLLHSLGCQDIVVVDQ